MTGEMLLRFAHCEGHLDLCYDESGDHIVTCGPDGDVHIYKGMDDDNPISHRIGDAIYCVACKNQRFYVASDKNAVEAYTFSDGQPDGIVTRFTAYATHMCFNNSGSQLVVGSSDFVVKLVDVATSLQQLLIGHTGPILSVSLHPYEHFVASSSCDGTVRVWNTSDLKLVKVISALPVGNDFLCSKSLSRITWDKSGKYLFVPMGDKIVAYNSDTWSVAFELTDNSVKKFLSVLCLSPCGRFIAASAGNGQLLVWDLSSKNCITRHNHEKKFTICGLAWHPRRNEMAFCDDHGYIGMILGIVPSWKEVNSIEVSDLFDDNDDRLLIDAAKFDEGGGIPGVDIDGAVNSDDGAVFATHSSVKDCLDSLPVLTSADNAKVVFHDRQWEHMPLQQPFKSGSSPVSLSARFMVWNSVGVIIQYNSEDEQSVNVEFHDTAVHHTMHINNSVGHTLGDVSSTAVILACEGNELCPSHLVCMHFGSWDNSKEWSISMPEGESIQVLCLSQNWLAVGTDQRVVRIFSIAGVQMQIFSLPGSVISLAANAGNLLVVYHNGLGLHGDQCLGIRLLSVSGNHRTSYVDHLPLSAKASLAWLGFSSEGTPFCVDSLGIVRMLNFEFGNTWVEVANLQIHCKGKTDSMWVVGVSENSQQIRAVLCKGSVYPPVLPRPTIQILPFKLPMCEMETDKGALEEQFWRAALFSNHFIHLLPDNFKFSESDKSKLTMAKQETLMKLFALACKSGREVRATELCHLMPNSRTVQLAIKYASRLHLIQLAERLGKVAQLKTEEQHIMDNGLVDSHLSDSIDNSHAVKRVGDSPTCHGSCNIFQHLPIAVANKHVTKAGSDTELCEPENGANALQGVLVMQKTDDVEKTSRTISDSQTGQRNPFRIASASSDKNQIPTKGTSIFDCMEKMKPGQQNWSKEKTTAATECQSITEINCSRWTKRRKLNSDDHLPETDNL